MEKQLKDLSISALKVLAYDLLANIEQNRASLQTVNQLIVNKSNEPQEPQDVTEKKPKESK